MDIRELSDQLELQQLVMRYAHAIDDRAFDRLDAIFTADAYIDYRAMGGIDGRYPQVREWLPGALEPFAGHMHLMGNCLFEINGDEATGKTACINPMVIPPMQDATQQSPQQTMFLGLWYLDRYQRTAAGWRISERVERRSFSHNVPAVMVDALDNHQSDPA